MASTALLLTNAMLLPFALLLISQYLSREEARVLDEDLMGERWGFRTEQLMELAGAFLPSCLSSSPPFSHFHYYKLTNLPYTNAGLSCACAIQKSYPNDKFRRILFIAGPGSASYAHIDWYQFSFCEHISDPFGKDNGGDGLVAARHLYHFGYKVSVYYPKRPAFLAHLLKQLTSIDVQMLTEMPTAAEMDENYDLFGDSIFGFSFAGDVRAPFDAILAEVNKIKIPIVAIDIPSGWDVDLGNVSGKGLHAETLISLTAPKLCARFFEGKTHWLGGRFVPKEAITAYNLTLPDYPGAEQCVELAKL